MKSLSGSLAGLGLLIIVTGCDVTPVVSDVDQREANQIVSVLYRRGIEAKLEARRAGRGGFSVTVSDEDYPRAATLLGQLGLPGEHQPTFEQMTASSGILPTSRSVDNVRLDRALAAELEGALSRLTTVVDAGVVVRKHSARTLTEASVTVVLKVSSDSDLSIERCKHLVENVFPTIAHDNILVSIHRSASHQTDYDFSSTGQEAISFMYFWRVPAALHRDLVFLFFGIVFFVAGIAGSAGYLIGQYRSIRRAFAVRSSAMRITRREEGRSMLSTETVEKEEA